MTNNCQGYFVHILADWRGSLKICMTDDLNRHILKKERREEKVLSIDSMNTMWGELVVGVITVLELLLGYEFV
jgi:hypothetical protein